MASLLNNASLLLNPAGSIISYQEDKIYSVLPRNGAGDFTFSGGDGGTRVNQQGYIEQTPANFMLNSGTTWTPYNVTVTTGVTDPVGGTRAYNISGIASGNVTEYAYKASNTMSLPAGTTFTYSLYMKGSGTIATYVERSIAGTYWFNVKVHTLSSEWQVFTHTYTVPTDASGVTVYVGNATGTTTTSVDIAFPMLNYGSTAKPYQPTTDRLNYPRITYQNGRGALLQEPQRTNVATNSETITASTGTTVSLNSGISPDGTQNADKLVEDTSNGNHITIFGGSLGGSVDSSTFCVSIFAKAAERTRFIIFDNNQGAGAAINVFDVSNGTKISGNGTIESYKDGWYRCSIFPSKTDSTTANIQIRLINTGTNDSYTGDGSSGMFFWGKQIEAGSFPTSYIPTTSATVTRPVEIFNDSSASSVIGQTEGTMFVDFVWTDLGALYPEISLYGNNNNRVGIYTWDQPSVGNDRLRAFIVGSSASPFESDISNTLVRGQRYKAAFAYKSGDNVAYVNGVNTFSNGGTFTFNTSLSEIRSNSAYPWSNNTHQFGLYTSRLTNTQLAELTTVRSGSGGTISYYGPYTIHTFTGSATFTPSFNGEVEVLVVAGGGGGGGDNGGGGGAGGALYVSSAGVSQGTGYTITVGAGGAGGTGSNGNGQRGASGNNSSAFGLTSIGGGGGGGGQSNTTQKDGGNGGSGGGGGGTYPNNNNGGAPGLGISGQGSNGGNPAVSPETGGGGGGAGGVGIQPSSGVTPDGGVGLPFSISGFSTFYAGGGAGGAWNGGALPNQGFGGLGGGGNGGYGASTTRPGVNGVNNLGGGGGGAGEASTGGTGGSGIVIVRYLT